MTSHSCPHSRIRMLPLFFLLLLSGIPSPSEASLGVTADCTAGEITVTNNFSVPKNIVLRAVLSSFPEFDRDCLAAKRVQTATVPFIQVPGMSSEPPETLSTLFTIPFACDVYLVTAVVTTDPSVKAVHSCRGAGVGAAESAGLMFIPPPEDTIQADLFVNNEIDLNAIDGTCLGFREYVAQVTNRPTSTTTYDIAIDTKYICSTSNPENPNDFPPNR